MKNVEHNDNQKDDFIVYPQENRKSFTFTYFAVNFAPEPWTSPAHYWIGLVRVRSSASLYDSPPRSLVMSASVEAEYMVLKPV